MTVALLYGKSLGSAGLGSGRGLGVQYIWTVGDEGRGGNDGTAGISAKDGVETEPMVEDLGTGANGLLIIFGGSADLLSDFECGCDGELDLCEREPTVEAGDGGARDSECLPGAVLGRLSKTGAFNDGIEIFSFSPFSLFLVPFRLYHFSFPTPLLFGDVGSTEGFPGMLGVASDLLGSWGGEVLAGDGMLPEADEFVETIEMASNKGFFSPLWLLILTEGTCRNVWNSPPCDFWGGGC